MTLGGDLRRAWLGYQRRLDDAMAAAGFDDRRFPDGRVLRMCRDSDSTTIADIGRRLAVSRQAASKIVASLRDRGYVSVDASATSGREKVVRLTPRALEYLAAHRRAARRIERKLLAEVGDADFDSAERVLAALAGGEDARLSDYLRAMRHVGVASPAED